MAARADYQRLHSFLSPSRRNPEQRQEATKHISEPDVNEVLNIARNSLIGSSAVFAGLLAIPFAPNFNDLEEGSDHFYLAALVLQLAAVACFLCTSIVSVVGGGTYIPLQALWRGRHGCQHVMWCRGGFLESSEACSLHRLWMLCKRAQHHCWRRCSVCT